MKIIIGIVLIGTLTAISASIFPWWMCGIIAFAIMLIIRMKPGKAFLAGFLGVGLCWGILTGWIDARNESLLSRRIGELFMGISPILIIIIGAVLGGLTGGFGGMTGGALAGILFKPKDTKHTTV